MGYEMLGGKLVRVRQVHGAAVLAAPSVAPDSEADALWCHRDDGPCVVGVLTARPDILERLDD